MSRRRAFAGKVLPKCCSQSRKPRCPPRARASCEEAADPRRRQSIGNSACVGDIQCSVELLPTVANGARTRQAFISRSNVESSAHTTSTVPFLIKAVRFFNVAQTFIIIAIVGDAHYHHTFPTSLDDLQDLGAGDAELQPWDRYHCIHRQGLLKATRSLER